jgi:phosphate transport system protein
MPIHFHRDLQTIRREVLRIGGLVEDQVDRALLALLERRTDLVASVLEGDNQVDMDEVRLEESALRTLALHQPVATDLRFLVTVIKLNSDLERMSDLAVNVAERAAYLIQRPPLPLALDFEGLGVKVREQLRLSLDALVNTDGPLARKVIQGDDEVDAKTRDIIEKLEDHMEVEPTAVRRGIHLIATARHLERIADLCEHVAEDIVFLVDGDVIRHHGEDYDRREKDQAKYTK